MSENESTKCWWFSKRIEDFPPEELAERIRKVMALPLADKIVTIPYVGGPEIVEYATDELIGLCPATGYPDIYKLSIRYHPDQKLPELKSLKFYLMQYLEIPISHEHLANKIYDDFWDKVEPDDVYLVLTVARRGGIDTIVEVGSKI